MDVGAHDGHEFDFSAMFDRIDHPARGRRGGGGGGATELRRSDGPALRGKGRQFIPHGVAVEMAFPVAAVMATRRKIRPLSSVTWPMAILRLMMRDIYGMTRRPSPISLPALIVVRCFNRRPQAS